jgi:acyl CoA:acetate/3-ketoacid CoA transferase alpha subunit
MKKKSKKKVVKAPVKYTATIIDTPVVWKNLKLLKGESFLLKTKPAFNGNEYVIENNLSGDITILQSDEKGNVVSWTELSKQFIDDEGYEIV